MGIDAAVLMCLRDIRHNKFEDSLIETVETSLGQGLVYFNYYPNKMVSLMDRNILDSLFLNIHFLLKQYMKDGSIPAALIYRIQYKVMNTCASRVLLKPQKGEMTLFIIDITKANVSFPRIIKWDKDSDNNSEQVSEEGSVSEKVINLINTKHWKTPSKLYYQRPTAPDLLLEERGQNNFKSFSVNNIYEWNIDAQTKYNIMNTLQHMTMVATTYQTSHECPKETIVDILVAGFSGQLKGWRDNYLTNDEKSKIYSGDKVRDKICSQFANGDIPYDSLSYGQLISYIQKVALKICQDDKIHRQLAKEKAQNKRDLGLFCEQFRLLAYLKQKKKQNPKTDKEINVPKLKTKVVCYNCGKQGHISKYCRLKKKLRNLSLNPSIEEKINNLLIETSEEETWEVSSEENLNQIQQDDRTSSSKEEDTQEINALTKEQDLLFEAVNSIPDPQEKKIFLNKLKKYFLNQKNLLPTTNLMLVISSKD
ncbi:hypothetical protein GYH30_016045 [Glycine max]|uniref:CCHC-type domain-containing protein n=1 Tax=Glycine max TaxID=3847 RepID=A0A0R0JKW9_SOYBN|nr:hypothetical protein GYH30_016045 [Glycine max]